MPRPRHNRGFTLVEALVASTLSAMLMLAILSSYIFLGRNLTRLANLQIVEAKSRIALGLLARDFQRASAVGSATSAGVTLTVPGGTVTYTYTYPTLTRVSTVASDSFANADLFGGDCTAFSFSYYSTTGATALSGTVVPLSVKRIGVSFTVEGGTTAVGTWVSRQTVSSRVLLRNKALPTGS
ncbi:MAG: prepilin-type N-terminal cleavage/methylation domain-containing protein [Undibacterium sp.]|nr:prepilin-type N-terminal cleavage/methylation domain-containing protein [Opitutaceae bacterium]